MVEDLLAARGIIVSHQTVRLWAEKFGRIFANAIRRRSSGQLGDKWHLDKAFVSIRGKTHWLWRAVDQDGFVLDVLDQSQRNAKRLMQKLLKDHGRSPQVMITDKLRPYGAAKREIMPCVEHRSHKRLNNRAENSHRPVRRRSMIDETGRWHCLPSLQLSLRCHRSRSMSCCPGIISPRSDQNTAYGDLGRWRPLLWLEPAIGDLESHPRLPARRSAGRHAQCSDGKSGDFQPDRFGLPEQLK